MGGRRVVGGRYYMLYIICYICYISQTYDHKRFEARKVVFFVGVSQHFSTGCLLTHL